MTERAVESKTRFTAALAQDWPRLVSIVLAAVGLPIALYLSYVSLTGSGQTMACPAEGQTWLGLPVDCGLVERSSYSRIGSIPVAVLGAGGYLLILLALLLEDRIPFLVENGRLALFGLTLFGFAFSAYLTWVEATQIRAYCVWCVVSAALMTALFILALVRLVRGLNADADPA